MIRLVASDMDGTLLDEQHRLPAGFFDLLGQMKKRGVHFVAASARSYHSLCCTFRQAPEGAVDYVCDNGAHVVFQGRELMKETLPPALAAHMLGFCRGQPDAEVILTAKGRYHRLGPARYPQQMPEDQAEEYQITQIEDASPLLGDITRLALIDFENSHALWQALAQRYGSVCTVVETCEFCVDIMPLNVNKGRGLARIQQAAGAGPGETMAFGDYYNDMEMLALAEYSFAMCQSPPEVKACCRYVAGHTPMDNVPAQIRKWLEKAPGR